MKAIVTALCTLFFLSLYAQRTQPHMQSLQAQNSETVTEDKSEEEYINYLLNEIEDMYETINEEEKPKKTLVLSREYINSKYQTLQELKKIQNDYLEVKIMELDRILLNMDERLRQQKVADAK